jgi:hypothetical protein
MFATSQPAVLPFLLKIQLSLLKNFLKKKICCTYCRVGPEYENDNMKKDFSYVKIIEFELVWKEL